MGEEDEGQRPLAAAYECGECGHYPVYPDANWQLICPQCPHSEEETGE